MVNNVGQHVDHVDNGGIAHAEAEPDPGVFAAPRRHAIVVREPSRAIAPTRY